MKRKNSTDAGAASKRQKGVKEQLETVVELEGGTVINCRAGEEVAFVGAALCTVLVGAVRVYGHVLTPRSGVQSMYSSDASGILRLRAWPSEGNVIKTLSTLPAEVATTVEAFKREIDSKKGALVLLQPLVQADPLSNAFPSLQVIPATQATVSLSEPCDIDALASAVLAHERKTLLLCGAKNVGKSTTARFTVNALLNHVREVAFLECDLGQGEFTPPGLVALNLVRNPLFGPPCSHLSKPQCAYFVGDNSPKGEPELYLASIRAILQTRGASNVPLVINTQGWIKGLGLELLHATLCDTLPGTIVYLGEGNLEEAGILPLPSPYEGFQPRTFCLPAQSNQAALGAAELRQLAFETYFGGSAQMIERQPLCIPWSEVGLRLIHGEVSDEEILVPFNGALVAFVACGEPFVADAIAAAGGAPVNIKAGILAPCVGLGVVRAVDMQRGMIYVSTPEPLAAVAAVNVIMRGALELPTNMIVTAAFGHTPYLTTQTVAVSGAAVRSTRRNLPRRRLDT